MQRIINICLLLVSLAGFSTTSNAQQASTKPTKIAILLFPGVELLDFAGPLEVFNHMDDAEVFTVAAQAGPMSIMQKMLTVTPEYTLATAPQPDILVVPGGQMEDVMNDSGVVDWIKRTTAGRQLTMSVCTGTYLLGKAGLLDGKTVTTHWAATDMLKEMMPKVTVMEHTRFVDAGALVTTAGVSAGIDGALHIVARLKGQPAAQRIARIMEYDKWDPEAGLVIGKKSVQPNSRPTGKVSAKAPIAKPTVVKKTATRKPQQGGTLSAYLDPVCRMSVPASIADTVHYAGKHYGFCSKMCKERFRREPTAYVKSK